VKFRVPTTGQVEKVYIVEASDSEQAHARVRAFINDPEMLGEGVVVRQDEETKYKTGEQVVGSKITPATGPQAVTEAKTA
jgi:hypothetical protein